MKRLLTAFLLTFTLAACTHSMPKPTNADGSVNPSVAEAEAELTYTAASHGATAFIGQCRVAMSTPGCSEGRIQQIKAADQKAYEALLAARHAVKTLPAGAEGIDKAIATLNAALTFLQAFLPPGN